MDVSAYGWVPLLSLSGVCFVSALGMNSVPFIVAAEVLPEKVIPQQFEIIVDLCLDIVIYNLINIRCFFFVCFIVAPRSGDWKLHRNAMAYHFCLLSTLQLAD